MNNNNAPDDNSFTHKLMWWTTLVIAVLAVPSFGSIVAMLIPMHGIGQIVIFIVACWFCTWLGMWLMKNPSLSEPISRKKD